MDRFEHSQPIPGVGTVGEFWQWAYSDFMDNTSRGVFAEWLVGKALGDEVVAGVRVGWECYDLSYRGCRIEVKTSGYVQSWHTEDSRRTSPTFGVGKTGCWSPETNLYSEPARHSNCYVFCLHTGDRDSVLDMQAWEFYIITTPELEAALTAEGDIERKSVGITWVREHCQRAPGYHELKPTIDGALRNMSLR